MAGGTETELKFEVDAAASVPDIEGMATVEDRTVQLSATYWDTLDRDLLRLGMSLRHRTASDGSEGRWTLKLGRPSIGDAVVRREITRIGPGTDPPIDLAQLLVGVTSERELRPSAVVETRRHLRRLGPDMFTTALELADDTVTSRVDGHEGPTFREIEVELLRDDASELLVAVGDRLRGAGLRPSTQPSKIARVLGGQPGQPRFDLDRSSLVTDYVATLAGEALETLLVNDPLLRLGDDGDAVHDARVATRRLRSHLKLLRPVLQRSRGDHTATELKWLGQLIGDLRDDEVLIEWIRSADPMPSDGTDVIVERLGGRRDLHHASLVSALSGGRYARLLIDLQRWVDDPSVRRSERSTAAIDVIRRRARRKWQRLRRTVHQLGDDPSPEQLHDIRKHLKQVRYTAQGAQRVGAASKRFAGRAGDVQDVLGDLHDDVVAGGWLSSQASELPGEGLFAAGRLSAWAEVRRADRESVWHHEWDRLDRRRITDWMD